MFYTVNVMTCTVDILRPVATEPTCSLSVFSSGCCRSSFGREGTNRARWPVSKRPMSTKPIFLTYFEISLPFDIRQKNDLEDTGLYTVDVMTYPVGVIVCYL